MLSTSVLKISKWLYCDHYTKCHCSFQTVAEEDTVPPIINGCPDPISVMIPFEMTSMSITWTEPTANDNSGMTPTLTQSHKPGDMFSIGTTQVTYTFTDMTGNQAQCSFTVTIGNYAFHS